MTIKKTEKTVKLDEIKVNGHNPRQIKQKEMDRLKKSLKDFPEMMELRPIVVDEDGVILGGNMRYQALVASGADNADIIQVEGLTEAQKREFIIKDNVPYGEWDWDALANEWDTEELKEWGISPKNWDAEPGNDEYDKFVDKFKPKLTTDDCYTPPAVFDVVEKWARKRYNITAENIRPFKPGGDYKRENYAGKIVIDNPPFSIFSEIVEFYQKNNVPFFLFYDQRFMSRPIAKDPDGLTAITGGSVTYENGAVVSTCFITNLESGKIVLAGTLKGVIEEAQESDEEKNTVYIQSPNLLPSASIASKGVQAGIDRDIVYKQDWEPGAV